MSAARRAWIVASSVGAVEAMKDQLGICRWNYVLRYTQQKAKNNLRPYSHAKKLSASSKAAVSNQAKKRTKEESMTRVMDLSCWGPNTTRF